MRESKFLGSRIYFIGGKMNFKKLICILKNKHDFGMWFPIVGARNKRICKMCGKEEYESVLPDPKKVKFSKEYKI